MARTQQTPKKKNVGADKGDTPLSKKSKPKMKADAPPKKKALAKADQEARMAIARGDVMKDEAARKTEQDNRTLYIRFSNKLPKTAEEIQELHSDIKFVRTPRKGHKEKGINYAFIEFGDAEECKSAKNKLATTQFKGNELVVDFVGENSKNKKKGAKEKSQLNPTRLFVCGLAPGVNKENLKEMFPKSSNADIPQRSKKKGTSFGFVQFSTPADAKSAFDAAQDLSIGGHRITVLFAKMTDTKPEVQKKKAEKRKAKEEKRKEKRLKADDNKENDETEVKEEKKKVKEEKKPVKVEETKEEEESGDDDDEDEEEEEADEKTSSAEKLEKDDEDEDDDDDDDDDDEENDEDKDDLDDTVAENKEGDDDEDDDDDEEDDDEEEDE